MRERATADADRTAVRMAGAMAFAKRGLIGAAARLVLANDKARTRQSPARRETDRRAFEWELTAVEIAADDAEAARRAGR